MVKINNRSIGDGFPCFITFEAGPSHTGLESAKKLTAMTAGSGADAIKFQIIDPDRAVADKKLMFTYEILVNKETGKTETITEPLYDIYCRRYLNHDEWRELKNYSDSLGLSFFATVQFAEDALFLKRINCDSVKIGSGNIDNWPLLRAAARTGMCIQLDTGKATIGEIEQAVDICREEGNDDIIIHNCPSGYPARIESINLNLIKTLKQMFGCPVAFSDHTPGWEMDIAAVALGANLIEKTITTDRCTRSVEHLFSLEPDEMTRFVKNIRNVETAMGNSRRILHPEELKMRQTYRRSAYLKSKVSKGDRVSLECVDFRVPGHGIPPNIFEKLIGLSFTKDLPESYMLTFADVE